MIEDTTTLHRLLATRAAERPERAFVSFPDGETSYRDFHARVVELARGLIATGLRPGGHVGLLMPNSPAYLELLFAVLTAGGVVVPINARFKRRELAFVLAHSDVELLITTDEVDEHVDFTALVTLALPGLADHAGGELALATAPRLRRVYLHGHKQAPGFVPLADLTRTSVDDEQLRAAGAARSAADPALLLYTSGTTADPKGCEITHDALVRSWRAYADLIGLEPDQSIWTPCPFFHVGGIGITVCALVRGATLLSMNHFDPVAALEHIGRRRAEHLFPAFPPLTLGLLRAPGYRPERLEFVRTVLNVAPGDTQRVIEALLPPTAVLLNDYGMTEASGIVTATTRDAAAADRLDRHGVPLPGIEVRVTAADEPDRTEAPETPGEIQFRGVNAFRAYYEDPDATAATVLPGGWVRTGDLGTLDARGHLTFVGRIKDVLKVGGENLAPAEVEAHLGTHRAVHLAQVIGRPSERYGEEPVAFVELVAGAAAGDGLAAELVRHCADHLASYKVPREIRFVTEWPMSATKIQKYRLREQLAVTATARPAAPGRS